MNTSIYGVDENGNAAVRVTNNPATTTDPTSIYGIDENGNAAMRIMGAGGGGGDTHNLGWFATPTALREAHPTAEDGDFAVVGSTDTMWVWDSDTTDWKDSGIQPTNNYVDLTNKPKINGVELSGNKTSADLGIKGTVQIAIEGTTTVQGYVVPNPTAEELTAVYNAVVAGNSVQIVDSNDVYYQVLQADSVDDAINVEILFFSEMSLLYTLENDTVSMTYKKLGGGLPDQTGQNGKFLSTNGTDASWKTISALQNTATGTNSLSVGGVASTFNSVTNIGLLSQSYGYSNVLVGYNASGYRNSVAIGVGANAGDNMHNNNGTVSIGYVSRTRGNYSIAIGYGAQADADGAIQISATQITENKTNSDANTFKVGNANGNFEIMSADGTIPEARLADTTNAAQGMVLTLDANLNAVWQAGGSGGGSVPTLTWYTVDTAGNTLTIADTSSAQLVKVYKNGLLLQPTEDYSISGTTLTTTTALIVGDKITTEVFA